MSTESANLEKESFLQELNAIYTIIEGGEGAEDGQDAKPVNQLSVARTNNTAVQSASAVAEARAPFAQVNSAAQHVREARNQIKTKVFSLREQYKSLTAKEEYAQRPDGEEVTRRREQAAAAAEAAAKATEAAALLREQEREAEAQREEEKRQAAEAAQKARDAKAEEEAAEREAAQKAADAAREAERAENAAAREERQAKAEAAETEGAGGEEAGASGQQS